MDIDNIVCIELRYMKQGKQGELSPVSSALTGSLVVSSTVLGSSCLQRIVCEMCARLGWVPLVYQKVDLPSLQARSMRALVALS